MFGADTREKHFDIRDDLDLVLSALREFGGDNGGSNFVGVRHICGDGKSECAA